MFVRLFLILLLFAAPQQQANMPKRIGVPPLDALGTSDSAASGLRRAFATLTSPELERRRAERRDIQQRGYASVVHSILAGDGLGALLQFMRLSAQLEFHLPHNTLYVYARVRQPDNSGWKRQLPGTSGAPSAPIAIPLVDDTSFPIDPWSKAH